MHQVVVRTLSRELRLHTDSDEAYATLSYAGADPIMPPGEYPPVDLTIERVGEFFRIEPPGSAAVEGTPATMLDAVFRLLTAWLIGDANGTPVLHSAVASVGECRFAFLGDKGFGKTTLMLKLLEEGFEVEGDEHLFVTAGGAVVRPRRLHVKESSLEVVPSLSEAVRRSPWASDWEGRRVFACRPSLLGARWELSQQPIRHLVFLEPNFGGSSILSPLGREDTFARLMEGAFMPPKNRGGAAASLRVLCVNAQAWRLQAGDLSQAVWHLQKATQRTTL